MERPWTKHVVEGNPIEIDIPNITIPQLLEDAIATYPDHIAMTFLGKTYTYRELKTGIQQTAAALIKLGIQKGDRVGLMLPNCPQYPISFFATLLCGATVVQVNPMYKGEELLNILNDSGTKMLIYMDQLQPLVDSILLKTSLQTAIPVSIGSASMPLELVNADGNGSNLPDVQMNPKDDVAVLQYTGGTTGLPKGAMLTHWNIVANTLQSAATSEASVKKGEERVLAVSPLFHVYGMTSAMCVTFYNGGNLILVPKFEVGQLVDLIETLKPTAFPGVPTMYIALVDYYKTRKFDLSCLTVCSSGSASLPLEILNRFNTISGSQVAEGYGLSEASPVTHRNPIGGLQKNGSIGIPIPNTDAKIVDVATGEQSLPVGEVGELVISGPQVMKGYWQRPEETSHAIRNGWLYTGDLAKMDEDGYFYIVGRKKEMIIASGYNVYPIEVENVLYNHPAVLEAAVIGVPHEYRGETIRAVVALKDGFEVTEQELIQFCKEHLAAYKVPKDVLFVDELPKTAVGKVLKRSLQEHYSKQPNEQVKQ